MVDVILDQYLDHIQGQDLVLVALIDEIEDGLGELEHITDQDLITIVADLITEEVVDSEIIEIFEAIVVIETVGIITVDGVITAVDSEAMMTTVKEDLIVDHALIHMIVQIEDIVQKTMIMVEIQNSKLKDVHHNLPCHQELVM